MKIIFTHFTTTQYGICMSENPYPDISTDWHSEQGALPAFWTTANVPVASANLTNLKSNTTYYVCPYFVNAFGIFYCNVTSFKTPRAVFQLDLVINEALNSSENIYKHCNTELVLHNDETASLPNFIINEMNWGISSTGWPNYNPILIISWSNGSVWGESTYHYTYWDECEFVQIWIKFTVNLNEMKIGDVATGGISLVKESIFSYYEAYTGPATLTRIE
jgi:hypothetical protein